MPFIAAAGVAVAGFLGGGTLAVAAGVAVSGAITGAIVGAATSLISGGNILEGALKGAVAGGLTAGVLSLGSSAISSLTGSSFGLGTAAEQLTKLEQMGNVSAATKAVDLSAGAGPGQQITQSATQTGGAAVKDVAAASAGAGAKEVVKEAGKGILSTPGGQMVAAGTIGGIAEGYLKGTAAEDAEEAKIKAEEERRRRNIPGLLNQVPYRLAKYKEKIQPKGLMATTG